MRRFLLILILLAAAAGGGAWVVAGRMPGPEIQIGKPEKFIGTSSPVEVSVAAPTAISDLRVVLEQDGKQVPLFSLSEPGKAQTKQEGDKIIITHVIDRQSVPELKSGAARLLVTAVRPVVYGIRKAQSSATRDVQVRLERPRVSVLSTHHYINLGGAEMIVYRVAPADVQSGVIVGDTEYPGYPATGIDGRRRAAISDPAAARRVLRPAARPGR